MKFNIDFSESISSINEARVLYKPFKNPKDSIAAYGVYVKNNEGQIFKVNFNAAKSSETSPLTSEYWGNLVNETMAAEAKEQTLDALSDFYYDKVVIPSNSENWSGYQFFKKADLEKLWPKLRLAPSLYTQNICTNKNKSKIGSDTLYNSEVKKKLDEVASK